MLFSNYFCFFKLFYMKKVIYLVVFILDRPRHKNLIEEIRIAGARVMARSQGDIAGALMAVTENVGIDVMMGVGGVSEGVISTCAIKLLRLLFNSSSVCFCFVTSFAKTLTPITSP